MEQAEAEYPGSGGVCTMSETCRARVCTRYRELLAQPDEPETIREWDPGLRQYVTRRVSDNVVVQTESPELGETNLSDDLKQPNVQVLGPGSIQYAPSVFPREGMTVPVSGANPKTLMGMNKVPLFSVVSPTALLHVGAAMRYGAYESPRKDGGKGYGPYNWRDQPVEASVYVDAAGRHTAQFWEGEDLDPKTKVAHLAHAAASLLILIDAIENGTFIDDRPKVRNGGASRVIDRYTRTT